MSTELTILGNPVASLEQAQKWAASHNATPWFIALAPLYWLACGLHGGVRPDVAYAQSAKETAFGHFGGVIPGPEWHNPCGMKTHTGGDDKDPRAHMQFLTDEDGVRAHLDHLALYAGAAGYPRRTTPDPRHFPFIAGRAKTVRELGGTWAPSAGYGASILGSLVEMVAVKVRNIADVLSDIEALVAEARRLTEGRE